MFVVTVEFRVERGRGSTFLTAVREQAQTSRELEPDCRQFDVCVDPADPQRVLLYEVYASEAAFQAHLASPHFRSFDETVRPWTRAKTVCTWLLLQH